ncbi:hypothetical protein LOK49_LG03G03923 [Camellia lanceoleosa]|uniref:Uncharacterized protein n=1 Tax=Camellia lanceoleosa TaxID=1840588 RepID=A0ACC0IAP6_9ERIC|nr:hypothetical protein LOK49_LG03G03923 [Camellia lanceoleosa]
MENWIRSQCHCRHVVTPELRNRRGKHMHIFEQLLQPG